MAQQMKFQRIEINSEPKRRIKTADYKIRQNLQTPRIQKTNVKKERIFTTQPFNNFQKKNDNRSLKDKKKLLNNLNTSQEMKIIDYKKQEFVSETSVMKFYKHHKDLNKILDQNVYTQNQKSVFTAILQKQQEMNMLPSKLGLVKNQGLDNCVNIKNHKFGDQYIEILSEGIQNSTSFNKYNLCGNRISQKGAQQVIKQISLQTIELDFSQNKIGMLGVENLGNLLQQQACELQVLNIEDNNLGNKPIQYLLQILQTNNTLIKLNISKNQINNQIGTSIKDILQQNKTLKELYLYWNQLNSNQCQMIFNSLIENQSLKVLDLSWNNLGDGSQSQIQPLLDCLKKNENLLHLDLSTNNFTLNECISISEAIQNNHTLYGFHFNGNYGFVDMLGYLQVNKNTTKQLYQNVIQNRINGVQKNKTIRKYQSKQIIDNCWICNQWQQQQFLWIPGLSSDVGISGHIFLHLDQYNYEGIYIGESTEQQILFKKMTPNRTVYFFFTVDSYPYYSDILPTIKMSPNHKFQNVKFGNLILQDFHLEYINYFEKYEQDLVLPMFDEFYNVQCEDKPRIPIGLPKQNLKIKWRPIWLFNKSIFKEQKLDSPQLLDLCFFEDWNQMRINKIIKDQVDLEKVKNILQTNYPIFKNIYKYLSAQMPMGNIWCVQWTIFVSFMHELNIYDSHFNENQMNVKFVAANADIQMKGNIRVPQRVLVRYQFIEVFIRIIEERYIQKNEFTTYSEALTYLVNEKIKQINDIQKYYIQDWKSIYYWNEENDLVLTLYKPILKEIYRIYAGKKSQQTQNIKYITLDEFKMLFRELDLINDNNNIYDLQNCYCYAMNTQVDEINSDRVFQMHFMEFCEAFSRVAQKKPIDGQKKIISKNQPLHILIEQLILFIKQSSIVSQDFWYWYNDIQHPVFLENGKINSDLY